MPGLNATIIGKPGGTAITCKCGQEMIPITFAPGRQTILCTRTNMVNNIEMHLNELGMPIIINK